MSNQKGLDSSHETTIANLIQRVKELESQLDEFGQIRQQLQEEHSFRKAVIEHAAEGICACHAIPEHPFVKFTIWNPRMHEITGYSMEQINRIGWYQSIYPDPEIQEKARQRMAKMRVGENLLNERWEITCSDGNKRTLGISTSILKTHDGQIHVLALMQDVTDQEKYRIQIEHRVATLEGLLSICSSCKKIRDENDNWHQLEIYISDHSEAEFSHGICPECIKELYPGFEK